MDQNTRDVLLSALALIGTLGGVWLGTRLQQGFEKRRSRQEAFARLLAIATELQEHLWVLEAALTRKTEVPPMPTLRADFERDARAAITSIELIDTGLDTDIAEIAGAVSMTLSSLTDSTANRIGLIEPLGRAVGRIRAAVPR